MKVMLTVAVLVSVLFGSCSNNNSFEPKRPIALLKDFRLDDKDIKTNTINIKGVQSESAMQLKYKSYLSTESLGFSVVFRANTASVIRIGRYLGGCIKIENNDLTVYKLNSYLSDFEVLEVLSMPFSIKVGEKYTVSCDKIDANSLIYSITASTGETYSVKYNKKELASNKRSVAIAWGTPFFGVISGDVIVYNAMLFSQYVSKPVLSIFGDSFIEGASIVDYGITKKWSSLLAADIGNEFVHISGKGGESADSLFVTRFKVENNLFRSPYVILALGTNNRNLNSYKFFMEQLIEECRNNNQVPVLQTIPPAEGVDYEMVTRPINDWVKASGELYIDFHKALTRTDGSKWKRGFVLDDGVHPSISGHKAMFEQVKKDLSFLMSN